jgi:hypothetical protein
MCGTKSSPTSGSPCFNGVDPLVANKYTLQLGYQSRSDAGLQIDESNQPSSLRKFWLQHEALLQAAAESTQRFLTNEFAATTLVDEFLPTDLSRRNVHIRTNWYAKRGSPKEILSGHADRGTITLHLFETDSGYLKGAPYHRKSQCRTMGKRETVRYPGWSPA